MTWSDEMCTQGMHYFRAIYDRYGNRSWICEYCGHDRDTD